MWTNVELSKEELELLQESLTSFKIHLLQQQGMDATLAQEGVKRSVFLHQRLQEALDNIHERENPTPTARDRILDHILDDYRFQKAFDFMTDEKTERLIKMLRKEDDEITIRTLALHLNLKREQGFAVLTHIVRLNLGEAYIDFYHRCDPEFPVESSPFEVPMAEQDAWEAFKNHPIPNECSECEFQYLIEEGEDYENLPKDWARELMVRT